MRPEIVPPRRCVVLFSGGLDSLLAARIMLEQGVEVEALNFQTIFTCCQTQAARAAAELGVRLTVISQEDDYLELIRQPRFGYGKGANPCVDCRIYMFVRARRFMEQIGADFVVSGEVLGQRPMSQKRRDLDLIPRESGLADLLLRPLSAKRLAPTRPECEGWVDRERLYDFVGRDRNGLTALAKQFGFQDHQIPVPSNGCALTEVQFSEKVFDLIELQPAAGRWDFELLRVGRHYRFDNETKVIVGRRDEENELLRRFATRADSPSNVAILAPVGFHGPNVLLVGGISERSFDFAARRLVHHAGQRTPPSPRVRVTYDEKAFELLLASQPAL